MTTDDRRLKDARRDAIPADPPSPLTAEEIAMVRAASPDPASFTARLLATLDVARASDAGLRAAILAIPTPKRYENDANGNWFTTDMEYGWDCAIEAAAALASSPAPAGLDVERLAEAITRAIPVGYPIRDYVRAGADGIAREYASSPAPATTNPRLVETDLVVPAPAGLDANVLGRALANVSPTGTKYPERLAAEYDRLRAATRPAEEGGEE